MIQDLKPSSRLRWLAWGVFTVVWTTALVTPQPPKLVRSLLPEDALFSLFKLAHVGCYALLAVLSGWQLVALNGRRLLLGFASAHAFATEFCQRFVPGRTASWGDVAIDHVGIALGVALTWKWWRAARFTSPGTAPAGATATPSAPGPPRTDTR